MPRRSTAQARLDRDAWPVTLRVLVPEGGLQVLGPDRDPFDWLRREIGWTGCAFTPGRRGPGWDCIELHFRGLEDATRFREAFPDLALADWTTQEVYSSPHLPFGRHRGDLL